MSATFLPALVRPLADTLPDALAAARELAPYLARLARRRPDLAAALADTPPQALLQQSLAAMRAAAALDEPAAFAAMRGAKAAAHLVLACADLSGRFDLWAVVEALTALADAALQTALALACRAEGVSDAGLFVIGLGKLGARELNYSSDVDVSVFYDAERFDGGARTPGETASRIARRLVSAMEAVTEDGYVFRTDLRLRPDPRSTPPAVSTQMAELYYESVGQNWERMVYIKARPVAGDHVAARAFLDALQPYVWRRHLDYWAIGDIHAIKRQINRHGAHARLEEPDADVKLGPGGIREVEFYAQTQQLILGGRLPQLRTPATRDALDRLVEAGLVRPGVRDTLMSAYTGLRGVEHRIQMLEDAQTHTLPPDREQRARVARLSGFGELQAFDAAVREVRTAVNTLYAHLFEDEERRAREAQAGNLVFTGVDHDPGTLATLSAMGFADPGHVIDTIADWHRGKVPATRTVRGREILTALVPGLLSALAATGEADLAFRRFSDFFAGLSAGVQTLAMLLAEPRLLADLARTLALAPKLSTTLARRPNLLEALLHQTGDGLAAFDGLVGLPFADALDAARRVHREIDFRIGFGILNGQVKAEAAGPLHADLADACIRAMAAIAHRETVRRFGPPPGGLIVCGMGKLGGRELSAGSDLDLIILYDDTFAGPFLPLFSPSCDPLATLNPGDTDARIWFARYTQSLITALSAPTAEGLLYEVDMALRPSGRAGPVAVSLSAFERYHREESWTWEHMALTRLRPIVWDGELGQKVSALTASLLSRARDRDALTADILDMRRRMHRERPGDGPWDLKLDPGGLVDIEFIVQHAILAAGQQAGAVSRSGTRAAIDALEAQGRLDAGEARTLRAGLDLLLDLQQVMRVAVAGRFDPDTASTGLKSLIARAAGADTFEAAAAALTTAKREIAALRCKRIGPLATESADPSV